MIKRLLQNIFEKDNEAEDTPWRTENSLLHFISTNLGPDGRLTDAAYDLPDKVKEPGQISFAPGLLDAMAGTDDSEESQAVVRKLAKLLKEIAGQGDKTSEDAFYKLVKEQEYIIGLVDGLLETIVEDALPVDPYLNPFVQDLITKTDNRNTVKLGIAIAGLCKDPSIVPAIKTFALHDEFTLYAIVALINILDTPIPDLWELAQKVDGWGKIQLVNRLANMELTPTIEDWLVYEGYRNNIMYEYLAYTCATNGRLHEKLEADTIDKKLYKATGEILEALINGGPAEDISMYENAVSTVENYIRHAHEHAIDIVHFVQLHKLKSLLTSMTEDIGEHEKNGWTQDTVSNCLIDLINVLNNRNWEQLTREALTSDNDNTYWYAKQAAALQGIDLWETFWQRLQQHPLKGLYWYDVTAHADADKAAAVIDFALTHLPLKEYATGPKDETGFGEHYDKYQCLDHVLGFLENYPQQGQAIILAALDSPVTRNRNMAIKALKQWTQEHWSDEILQKIKKLKKIEPNADTKKEIEALLQ